MNERIKELDKQAVDYALSVCDANGVYQGKEYLAVVKEKFAQLIVKECMTNVLKESKWYWDKDEFESSNAIQNAARRVNKTFGVE